MKMLVFFVCVKKLKHFHVRCKNLYKSILLVVDRNRNHINISITHTHNFHLTFIIFMYIIMYIMQEKLIFIFCKIIFVYWRSSIKIKAFYKFYDKK